jgi:endothelin-converting enzyme/putative endopeptidase
VRLTDGDLGEALGQPYVKATFGEDGKERMLRMVHALEKAMGADIKDLPWMTEETKRKALDKLEAIGNNIGYPDTWRDYATVQVVRGDLVGNVQRANEFETRRDLAKIGRPVDRFEWSMSPPTVNAYASSQRNTINFPAGILQPPFFDKTMDDAVNYGAIGVVIGHEMSHLFDDQGRKFDKDGNLNDWWTAADAAEFEKRVGCIADEYSQFVATSDIKLNGRLTLGENTGDNGGIRIAYMALEETLAGKPAGKIDGFTPQQRFFLGYAQIWCENRSDEIARLHAQTNPHSPGRYRVNGVVSNMPEFQQAFNCKAGQPMVREPMCRAW